MAVAFISHPDCGRHDTGWGHREHVGRLVAIPRALKHRPELLLSLHHHEGRHATIDELALVHERAYIAQIEALAAAGGGRLDEDTVASGGSWEAATAGAGCVLDGVDMAFDAAFPPCGHRGIMRYATGPWASASSAMWRSRRTTPWPVTPWSGC